MPWAHSQLPPILCNLGSQVSHLEKDKAQSLLLRSSLALRGPGESVTRQRGAMGEEREQRQIFARGMNRPSHMQLPSDGWLGLGMRKVLQVLLSRTKAIG